MVKKVEGIKKVPKKKPVTVKDETKEASINVKKEDSKSKAKKEKKKKRKKDSKYHVYQLGHAYDNSECDEICRIKEEENGNGKKQKKEPEGEFVLENLNVVFMGTGKFAGNILEKIIKFSSCKEMIIITQPDKKLGRKKTSIKRSLAPNLVRNFAKETGMTLYQPEKLDEEAIKKIKSFKPDAIVVASYGKILPEELLSLPKYSAINIHASLLPKLRGASPIQNALLSGLKETGVTIMKMDTGLDTGDILLQKKLDIEEHERADALLERLSKIGASLLIETAKKRKQGALKGTPQDSSQATLCQMIDREDGHLQWTQTTEEIYNRYRALYPWPGVFSYWQENENQFMRIKFISIHPSSRELTDEQNRLSPGTVFINKDQLCIKTFDGAIIIETLQPECKVAMPIYDFLNGHKSFEGAVLQ